MMNSLVYRIIGFGENENGFFNQPVFASTKEKALNLYDEFYRNPEIQGAVMIESQHENWRVVYEFGVKDVEVVCSPLFTFSVVKSLSIV